MQLAGNDPDPISSPSLLTEFKSTLADKLLEAIPRAQSLSHIRNYTPGLSGAVS